MQLLLGDSIEIMRKMPPASVDMNEPLIKPQESGRHYFWANFIIPIFPHEVKNSQIGRFGPTKRGRIEEKSHLERDKVDSRLGLAILKAAFKEKQEKLIVEG